jgi:hypothetical protein
MSAEKEKSYTVNGHQYVVKKLPASDSCFLFMQSPHLRDGVLTEDQFRKFQLTCLKACYRINEAVPTDPALPVLMQDGTGRFAFPDLTDDGPTVMALVMRAMDFNITPFLNDAGLNEALADQASVPAAPSAN